MTSVTLGDKCRDSITGFEGIAVAKTLWLHGCVRISLQPEGLTKERKVYPTETFDEPALVVVKRAKAAPEPPRHGPRDDAAALRRSVP